MKIRKKTRKHQLTPHNQVDTPLHALFALVRSACIIIGRPIYYALTFSLLAILLFFTVGIPNLLLALIRPCLQIASHIHVPTLDTPTTLLISYIIAAMIVGGGVWFYLYILKDLPSPRELITRKQILTTKIYDRNGVLLYKIFKDENRTLVPLSAIPDALKHASIAIEDKDFYKHNGLSIRGIARAIKANLEKKHIQGGSTITQQLVKNTLLSPEKTIRRKLKEIVLSLMVEATLSKDEILQMYFNEVSYGGSVYGVEEASRRYFGKSVKELSLAESAYLAGLPQAPSAYSPFGPHPELGFIRQQQVLQRMLEDGYITEAESTQAKQEKLTFQPDANDIKAPHFVMYVKDLLAQEYGEEVVSQGGLEVFTSLDYDLQKKAEAAVNKELDRLKGLHVTNGAALVTDPRNGEILAMVGSRNYFDIEHDGQVNVTIRPRQPGSSIKPLTYATAFEKGLTPSSIIDDAPITFKTIGSPPYSPKNYDGRFHGKVMIRTALASSYNIPAVKTLASVGVQAVVKKGRELGLTTWDEASASRFGLSLTLGSGEVLMVDMAKLYGTFANNGVTTNLHPILSVKNAKGNELYKNPCVNVSGPCEGTRTLDPRIAYQITDILSDNIARSPAFGTNSVLNIPKQRIAVKTGTTNTLRDNWTIGYTAKRVVLTWVGNNDNTPMSNVASGITGASPIWNSIMRTQLDENNPEKIAQPEGLLKVRICVMTGTLPCSACPVQRDDYFVPGTEPKNACKDEFFTQTPSPSPIPAQAKPRDRILDGSTQYSR